MSVVSISDVEAVREGHQSEVLLSIADEFPPDRCFTLVFRGRRGNLDLVAESAEEAQSWVNGVRKLIKNLENMDQREKLDQYPSKTFRKSEVIFMGLLSNVSIRPGCKHVCLLVFIRRMCYSSNTNGTNTKLHIFRVSTVETRWFFRQRMCALSLNRDAQVDL